MTEKFSDYLHLGLPFEVFTDNNPLTYILTSAKLNATGLRWVARLADYNFSIKYRAGKKHIDADYLSRHPVAEFEKHASSYDQLLPTQNVQIVLSDVAKNKGNQPTLSVDVNMLSLEEKNAGSVKQLTTAELVAAQRNDGIVGPVYETVLNGKRMLNSEAKGLNRASRLLLSQFKKLKLVNGVLMRNTCTANQIVLPRCYHELVYRELHQNLGHLGPERVVELARKRFYWPYMQKNIEFFIQNKCPCIKSKKPNVPEKAKLVPIDATSPFELVSIDFIHLDRCKGGYEYALVVVDHFTRFIQLYPTKNKSARSAADQIFNKYILSYGFPRRIHHDQGREFNNSLFDRLQQLSGISGSRTTAYHPMGDGQPERVNRTLVNMLKCLGQNEKANWKDHLAKLAFAYNSTVNKATNYSPFYLMMGRESRLPIDLIFDIDLGERQKSSTYDQFVRNWHSSMKQAVDIAQKHIDVSKKYNIENYNKKVKYVETKIGDYVLLRNLSDKGGTGKLRSYWQDVVYEVVDKDPNLPVFTIRSLDGKKAPKRVHRNNIMSHNFLPFSQTEPAVDTASNSVPLRAPSAKSKQTPLRKPKENTAVVSPAPIQILDEVEDEPSSDEDIVVVRQFSAGEDKGVLENDAVVEDVREEVESVVETSVEEVAEHVEADEGNDDSQELDDTVAYDEDPDRTYPYEETVDTGENEPNNSNISDSDDTIRNSSSDSDSDTICRRSGRTRKPPSRLTYDNVGVPSLVQR